MSGYYGFIDDPRAQPPEPVIEHGINTDGRDFVIGDLHAQYDWFDGLLDGLAFDPARDRMFCVGDLVDRGKHSFRVDRWLSCPWFLPIRGNHDQMVIENLLVLGPEAEVEGNSQTELYHRDHRFYPMRIGRALHPLRYVREVTTELGTVAIVHGTVPLHISRPHSHPEKGGALYQYRLNMTWAECKARMRKHDEETVYRAQWELFHQAEWHEDGGLSVPDVDLVVSGHDHVVKRRLMGDYLSIDYGAGHRKHREWATLCAVQIHPGAPRLFHYGPADEKVFLAHRESTPPIFGWDGIGYGDQQRNECFREVPYPPIEPGWYAEDHTKDDQKGDEDNG